MTEYSKVFLVLDMQNDLCNQDGVYAKHGLFSTHIESILPNIANAVTFCQKNHIPVIATQLTVLTDTEEQGIGLGYTQKLRPFLVKEGFREGSWGHDLVEQLPEIKYRVKKWSTSAFYQTELSHYLSTFSCQQLILTGFPTNGTIETTAREAISRNLKIVTLTDCVAGYSESLHQASLTNLGAFGDIISSKEWMAQLSPSLTTE